ncbi:uncharacterized protein YdaU (DUF1376 family) [Xylophilus ampelinus]|uniref:Uncharacterized protein YdaU (DUF1376 family) n=2 Tax=Xylophilus ampelinus TaxID=54067 RepID=A0A318T1V7_9BURK|nr:uncharacterized protein YdaU (DUF1376 family) [Xylophilus ampelinus]
MGDYAADTQHLSWDEDCAYRRLLDQYYKREKPIPVDLKQACRLARAVTPAQRRAVEAVLREFFEQQDDGWHQARCDREIGVADAAGAGFGGSSTGGGGDGAKPPKGSRQEKYRSRRKSLFDALASRGVTMPRDASMDELADALVRATPSHGDGSVTPDASRVTPAVTSHRNGETSPTVSPEDGVTSHGNQTPDARHQTPDARGGDTHAHAGAPPRAPAQERVGTPAGEACRAMRQAGLADANPAHPTLIALLDAGITLPELVDAAADAVQRGKTFAYALATAKGRRHDAANTRIPPMSRGRAPSATDERANFLSAICDPGATHAAPDHRTVDADARVVA